MKSKDSRSKCKRKLENVHMARQIAARPPVVLLVAIGVAAVSYLLWEKLFLMFQRWYFQRYIQPNDPHPPFLPFTWESFWLLPIVSATTAGTITGIFFERGNRSLPLLVGVCVGIASFALFGFHRSSTVVLTSIAVAFVSSVAYYLAQVRSSASQ